MILMINIILFLYAIHYSYSLLLIRHCNPLNKSTYVIPEANNCTVGYGIGCDSYYFGPCYNITSCFDFETNCMFADGRDNYCLGIDNHFCSFCDSGKFINYFQVEC